MEEYTKEYQQDINGHDLERQQDNFTMISAYIQRKFALLAEYPQSSFERWPQGKRKANFSVICNA